jgi:hypothetical protein
MCHSRVCVYIKQFIIQKEDISAGNAYCCNIVKAVISQFQQPSDIQRSLKNKNADNMARIGFAK